MDCHSVAVIQYTCTHKQYIERYNYIWYDMIWYDIWYDMIYLLTAIGLSLGGSNTVHMYTQTIHRTIQTNNK